MRARWRSASTDDPPEPAADPAYRLVAITLDEGSIGRSNPDVEHERAVAIYDLLENNVFVPVDHAGGPYALHLGDHREPPRASTSGSRTARR